MRYLVDGHNLIARLANISLADPDDEAKLIQLLARWRWRHNNVPVTVVFDPGDFPVHGRRRLKQSGIHVHYAPHSSNADLVIVSLIERTQQPAQLTVVSSDREVLSAARQMGAHTMSADKFADELVLPAENEKADISDAPLSPEEVEAWLEIFQS